MTNKTTSVAGSGIGLGIALLTTAYVLWGAMGTAAQYLFKLNAGFEPTGLVSLRQLAAGAVFVLFAGLFQPKAVFGVWRDWRIVLGMMLSGVFLCGAHMTFFAAIQVSNAGTGAILLTTVPLFVCLWYALTKHRPIAPRELLCMGLAAAGVLLIISDGNLSQFRFSPAAVFWGLASAVISGAYSIQSADLIKKAGVLPVVAWSMVFGGIFASIFTPPFSADITWSLPAAAAFAFIVLFGTVLAFWAFLTGLKRVSPVTANLLNCVDPLAAYFFSFLLLADRPGIWQAVGIVCVLADVVILSLGGAKESE